MSFHRQFNNCVYFITNKLDQIKLLSVRRKLNCIALNKTKPICAYSTPLLNLPQYVFLEVFSEPFNNIKAADMDCVFEGMLKIVEGAE